MENSQFFKGESYLSFMINRSFYLYKLKFNEKLKLPNFLTKFSLNNVVENIIEIQIAEDEKRKHLLIITKKEGNYLYGFFFRLKEDVKMNICDEGTGEMIIKKLEENQAWVEKSHFIFDTDNHLLLGEYNDEGIRFFQFPFGEYIRNAFNREDLDLEVVYNKESYENLANRNIKYFKIKVAKPKLTLMENIFSLSGLEVFDEADDSSSLFVELKISAGRRKSFTKAFVEKVLNKFNEITDKKGIKKFEVGQSDFDMPLELVKDKILRRKIDIENKADEEIFSEIVNLYEELSLDELLDKEEEE